MISGRSSFFFDVSIVDTPVHTVEKIFGERGTLITMGIIRALRDLFLFMVIVFIIMPLWCIAAGIEQGVMWLRGYSWDPWHGNYRKKN